MTKWNGTQGPMAPPKARFDYDPSGRPRLIIWPRLVPGKKGPLRVRPKTYLLIFSRKGIFDFSVFYSFRHSYSFVRAASCYCSLLFPSPDRCDAGHTSLPAPSEENATCVGRLEHWLSLVFTTCVGLAQSCSTLQLR